MKKVSLKNEFPFKFFLLLNFIKLIIIILKEIAKTPGCEKFKDFKGVELKSCCASMPELNMAEAKKDCDDCKSKEKGEKMCCFTDCMFKNMKLLDSKGLIDADLMKAKLGELVDKNETWVKTIDEVMADCVKEG